MTWCHVTHLMRCRVKLCNYYNCEKYVLIEIIEIRFQSFSNDIGTMLTDTLRMRIGGCLKSLLLHHFLVCCGTVYISLTK